MILYGFWHNRLGADPKLIAAGHALTVSRAVACFQHCYPTKAVGNLVLTTDRSLEQYRAIMAAQEASR